ncbi:MAG: lysophospholipid acyltransferase family protein [Candidatus Binatia bacterium]
MTPVNEYGFDPFGFDKQTYVSAAIPLALLYRYWFRTETSGLGNLPKSGPVLIVANHAGNTFAWDAAMIAAATLLEAEPPRIARGLAEYYLPTLPFLGSLMTQAGTVVGTPENCAQLFERGECVMVFPEGARGAIKPYSQAYRLQRFGLGFMRMALEYRVPILPVGVVGSEEANPGLYDSKLIARLLGSPGFPVTLTFPWLGLAGFLPLPVKFRLQFGALMRFEGPHDAEDREIEPKAEEVKAEIGRLIAAARAARSGWF